MCSILIAQQLKLDYLDLYLIHWPSAVQPDIDGGWKQFERIKDDGLAKCDFFKKKLPVKCLCDSRSIGVSNFTLEQLQSLVKSARILPAANQVHLLDFSCCTQPNAPQISFSPYNYAQHKALLAFSAEHGIVTEAYSALACVFAAPSVPTPR
jgi:diketogulonate reductase-like aldo/keto reductase